MVGQSRLNSPPGFARRTGQARPGLRQGIHVDVGAGAQGAGLAQGVGVPSLLAPYDPQHLLSVPPGPDGNVLDRSRVVGVHSQHLSRCQLGQGSAGLPDRAAQPWHRDFQGAVGNRGRAGCRRGFLRAGGGLARSFHSGPLADSGCAAADYIPIGYQDGSKRGVTNFNYYLI